jgi:hypothetical protein
MRHLNKLLVVCTLLVFSLSGSLSAQAVSATLLGTVTDSSGAVVIGAKVTVTEADTGFSHSATSNESGNFSFGDLPPGQYNVTVEITGFKKETRKGIDLLVNSSQRVDVQLIPGAVSETVEVTGAPPTLQTDRADTGRKIDLAVLADMPVLSSNRNYQSLLNLVPGTAPATEQHSQFFNASSSLQTEVNGEARVANSYQIEGIDDNERTGLLQVLIPPLEAIQTVDISTSNHSVDLGRGAGAITNVILKSGTNQFHGSAYEFLQNSDFNSRSFFNPTVGAVHYNYFGGTIGGPIKKNKLFFFSDYLLAIDHEANTNLVTVPSMLSRTGNLSENAAQVYDPLTGNTANGVGRTKFPNNIIPSQRLDPIAQKILALVPAPNLPFNVAAPSNNYYAVLPFTKTAQFTDTKIDYAVTDKDRISGRFSFQRPVVFQAPLFGTAGGPGPGGAFMGTGVQKTYSSGLNWTHVFTPTLLGELRFGVAHYHNEAQNSDYGTTASQGLGIPNINISQFTSGLVGVNGPFSNPMVGYSASLPWVRAEANIDLVNNWTKTMRNHTFTFGFDMRRLRDDLLQTQTYSPRGLFAFGTSQTGCAGSCLLANGTTTAATTSDSTTNWNNTMGSLLLDLPNNGSGRDFSLTFPTYRAWQFFSYVGDKWQVSNKLTVDIGVRWELYPPAVAAFPAEFSNFNPANNTLVVAGVAGNPANLGMNYRKGYFGPRLGIAYRLNEKTVVRVGYGVSYTPFGDNKYAWDNYPVKGNVGTVYGAAGSYGAALLPSGQPVTFATGIPVPAPVPIPANGIYTVSSLGFNGSGFETIPLNYKNPYVEAWNLTIQRALPYHFTLDVAYVGNHGVDTATEPNINASPVIAATSALGLLNQPEYPRTGGTTVFFQGFSSMYNALQVKLDRRFFNGLGITTSFTYGKGMSYANGSDDNGFYGFYQAGQGRRNYIRNNYDRKFTFVQSYIYELPFGKGKAFLNSVPAAANYIIGGWKLQGTLTVMTGTPFSISYSSTYLNEPGTTNTAQQVASSVNILHGINTTSNGGSAWFDPTAFAAPPCQSSTVSSACPSGQVVGNVGANSMTGPGFFDVNLALAKDTKITERVGLQLRVETQNLTNTAQFSNPSGSCCTANNANFGFVTGTLGSGSGVNGTGGGRSLQLAVKVTF